MLLPGLTHIELGNIAETFVKYKLERWGESVVRATTGDTFDLVVLRDKPIKIQVKSSREVNDYSYKFRTGHTGIKKSYVEGDYDILAFVALDLEQILFQPFSKNLTISVHPEEFEPGEDLRSWYQMLDIVGE